jgi:hypothetical protein
VNRSVFDHCVNLSFASTAKPKASGSEKKASEKPVVKSLVVSALPPSRRYETIGYLPCRSGICCILNDFLSSSFAEVKKSEEALYHEVQRLTALLDEKAAFEEELKAEIERIKGDVEVRRLACKWVELTCRLLIWVFVRST